MTPDVEAVRRVLDAHATVNLGDGDDFGIPICTCGEHCPITPSKSVVGGGWYAPGEWHRAHVAAELAPLLQNARAEGWDEAVKALAWCLIERCTHPDVGLPYVAKNNPYRQEPDHD